MLPTPERLSQGFLWNTVSQILPCRGVPDLTCACGKNDFVLSNFVSELRVTRCLRYRQK